MGGIRRALSMDQLHCHVLHWNSPQHLLHRCRRAQVSISSVQTRLVNRRRPLWTWRVIRKQLPGKRFVPLLNLALADLCQLSGGSYKSYLAFSGARLEPGWPTYVGLALPFFGMAATSLSYLLVTALQFFAVYRPLRYQIKLRRRHTLLAAGLVWLAALPTLLAFPTALNYLDSSFFQRIVGSLLGAYGVSFVAIWTLYLATLRIIYPNIGRFDCSQEQEEEPEDPPNERVGIIRRKVNCYTFIY